MKVKDALQLRRTAKEVKKSALLFKGATILCIALVAIISVTYAISYFYDKYGSFTVSLDKYDMIKQGLSLSETQVFNHPISRLNADAVKNMTNISGNDLPENIDAVNGNHSGEDYIAYTFYLKNTGQDTVSYDSGIYMTGISQNIDAAIRLRLYVNGEPTTYAKIKDDGSGPEAGTVPFLAQTQVMGERKTEFAPGDMDKFTVVIWLEGDDPECVDDIIGGRLKLEMKFRIVESS